MPILSLITGPLGKFLGIVLVAGALYFVGYTNGVRSVKTDLLKNEIAVLKESISEQEKIQEQHDKRSREDRKKIETLQDALDSAESVATSNICLKPSTTRRLRNIFETSSNQPSSDTK